MRPRDRRWIGPALLAIVAVAAGPEDAAPAPGRMVVIGRVLDPGGKPVPEATVRVQARNLALARPLLLDMGLVAIGEARTDASGRFRIEGPRTSTWRYDAELMAVAMAPGFGIGWAELDVDADRPVAEIALRPEQIIRGRVLDPEGRAVAGASVSVQSIEGLVYWRDPVREMPAWPRPATADAEGRFTLLGLGLGLRAFLTVHDPRFALQRIRVTTDDTSGSRSITAAMMPAQVLTGRLTYADTGRGVPHATIRVMSSQRNVGVLSVFETDAEGRFRLNPPTADSSHRILAFPPEGQPYIGASTTVPWPAGTTEKAIDVALPRGVLARGTVVEEVSGRPIAGATVDFYPRAVRPNQLRAGAPVRTAADGSFRLGVEPGPGYLFVRGPGDDYLLGEISSGMIAQGRPGGTRYRSHAHLSLDPKPGADIEGIRLTLRRGVTVIGQVIGPDGRPVDDAWILGRAVLDPSRGARRIWNGGYHVRARGGRFELHGLDPGVETPVFFFDPARKLGATVNLSGKSIALMMLGDRAGGAGPGASIAFRDPTKPRGPITIRLGPCGAAVARLVDPDGQPIAGPMPRNLAIKMVATPGPPYSRAPDDSGALFAEEAALTTVDPVHYANGPAVDADGRLALPVLIPGATYRFLDDSGGRQAAPKVRKEFTAEAGATLDLGDIRIEKPAG